VWNFRGLSDITPFLKKEKKKKKKKKRKEEVASDRWLAKVI
jgi:hypothetical protein